jgi:polysaccharide export outer membrane protein
MRSRSWYSVISLLIGCFVSMANGQQLQTRSYVLHPGDTLDLQYRLTPDLNQTVIIQPDGIVSLNVAGQVHVAGLTLSQAHDQILVAVSSELNNPQLNLVLKDFVHPHILIAGEVARPGSVEVRENMTAFSAIMAAGGFTPDAKSGQVLVFRKVDDNIAEVRKLDLTRFDKKSEFEHDMPLQPGDMIYVTRDKASRIEHYMKVANLGMYFNPFPIP